MIYESYFATRFTRPESLYVFPLNWISQFVSLYGHISCMCTLSSPSCDHQILCFIPPLLCFWKCASLSQFWLVLYSSYYGSDYDSVCYIGLFRSQRLTGVQSHGWRCVGGERENKEGEREWCFVNERRDEVTRKHHCMKHTNKDALFYSISILRKTERFKLCSGSASLWWM